MGFPRDLAQLAPRTRTLRRYRCPDVKRTRARSTKAARVLTTIRLTVASLSFKSVTKSFGDVVAVDDLSLEVADREFLVLLGPSGCGKSTALRMVAGLDEPTSGAIAIGDRVVHCVEPKDHDLAMVFQSYAVHPHKSLRKTLKFPLLPRGASKTTGGQRVG